MKDDSNKKFWDRVSKIYTVFQEKGNKDLYETLSQTIKPKFEKDQKILELGCGTGQLTTFLLNKSNNYIATDFSEKMISEAKIRFKNKDVLFEVEDATNLSYENDSFDVVLIANALHIMPSPNKALKEIKRVLKKDGILIAPTFVYEGNTNKFRLKVMEKVGFKTFYKWTSKEYREFVEEQGFCVIDEEYIYGEVIPECILTCKIKEC